MIKCIKCDGKKKIIGMGMMSIPCLCTKTKFKNDEEKVLETEKEIIDKPVVEEKPQLKSIKIDKAKGLNQHGK